MTIGAQYMANTTARESLRVDRERLMQSFSLFNAIGATERGGCNRQALTDEDKAGRDLFCQWAREAGCSVRVDGVGNIFARREGDDPSAASVLASSHIDTQATGGRFDGLYGVLAGLEVIRVLNDRGIRTRRPVEVAAWTNEEGCRFVPAMLGSGAFAGEHDMDFALSRADAAGRTVGEELERIGYRGEHPVAPYPIHAAFEAHIEQGPILEKESTTIGVVTGIQGLYWLDVVLSGVSCHAGPTPMEQRRDPWRAATRIIERAFALAEARSPWGRCTIGNAQCQPGARNTVPETVTIAVDIRHPEKSVLESMLSELQAIAAEEAAHAQVDVRVEQIWHMPPTPFAPELVDLVERTTQSLGFSHRRIVSGAGHDSLYLARVAPTTMIFVPCAEGLSHNEAEDAEPAHLAAGADVLLQAMLAAADQ